MNIFDTDNTYDQLWGDKISSTIATLINNALGNHFPTLGVIWLIERYCPKTKPWAEDWVTLAYDFLKPLTRTHLLNNGEINGSAYGFEPEYTADLPNNLSVADFPDRVTLKVYKGQTVSITWIQRSHAWNVSSYAQKVLAHDNDYALISSKKVVNAQQNEQIITIKIDNLICGTMSINGNYQYMGDSNNIHKIFKAGPPYTSFPNWKNTETFGQEIQIKFPKQKKAITIEWLEKGASIKNARYCNRVSNSITCWHREERSYTAPKDKDLEVSLDSSFWLINSCVITGNGLLVGITNAQKELIMYEFLDKTLDDISGRLKLTECKVLTAFDVVYDFDVTYNDFFSHYPRSHFPTYGNALFQVVPGWYYFCSLEYASQNPWTGENNSRTNKGKTITLDSNLSLRMATMKEIEFPVSTIPANLNVSGDYHYKINRQVENTYSFPCEFDYYLNFPFSQPITGLLTTAQKDCSQQTESGCLVLDRGYQVTPLPSPDYMIRRYQNNSGYWFYMGGLFQGSPISDDQNPFFQRCDISIHNVRYCDSDPTLYTDLFQSREILLIFLAVMEEKEETKSNFLPPRGGTGYYIADTQSLDRKNNLITAYLKLKIDLGGNANSLTPTFTLSTLEESKSLKYSSLRQGNGFWYEYWSGLAQPDDPPINISETVSGVQDWIQSINKSFTIKREFWASEPTYKSSPFSDFQIQQTANSLDPDTDNGDIMPDSQRVKDLDFRLQHLCDWMGMAQQPDGSIKSYPDPYHHDDLSKLQGYQFAAFSKPENEANPAAIYEVITNRATTDKLGSKLIKQGGFVKTFNYPQMLEQFFFDISKGLGLQESGGIQVTKGDNSGVVTYESQLAIAIDTIRTLSSISKNVNELIVQAARQQVLSQSILAATGVRISTQHIPFEVNGQTMWAEVACIAPGSPSLMDEMLTLELNTAILVGGNLSVQEVN